MTIMGFTGEIFLEDKIVAHYKDGRIVKGHTRDFSPLRDSFTLQPYTTDSGPVPIFLDDLKAVFHVRTFEGNPDHPPRRERIGVVSEARFSAVMGRGRKVALEFHDGERLWGFADAPDPGSTDLSGFFFFPTDAQDNNLRLFVVRSSVKEMVYLDN